MKLVPVNVIVNPLPPAPMDVGEIDVSVGIGFGGLIVNVSAFDVVPTGNPCGPIPLAPPTGGFGLNTVTEAVPTVAISAAVMVAVNCEALTNVVVRLPPFHCTTAVFSKLLPFTVSVKAAPPANAEFGTSVVSTATGVVTLNVAVFDVPPPGAGLTTTIGSVFTD